MKPIFLFLLIPFVSFCQNTQELNTSNTGNIKWDTLQKEYMSEVWNTKVITNVSSASYESFIPKNPNGTAVLIAPGGGMYALSIESEGREVARWLNEKGIAAFVLKYRLVPTNTEATKAFMTDGDAVYAKAMEILPLATEDALAALDDIIARAQEYQVDPTKIGMMGFSAGGALTMNTSFNTSKLSFIVPVYAWMPIIPTYKVPKNAPPMLVICSADDPLQLAPASIELYQKWTDAQKPVELHMYAKGGHGFGMKTQNLPSDHWIERFYDWGKSEGLFQP